MCFEDGGADAEPAGSLEEDDQDGAVPELDADTEAGLTSEAGGASSSDADPGSKLQGCAAEPCQHGGNCAEDAGIYSCLCDNTGYQGATCDTDMDECAAPNVCAGTSFDGVSFSYACENEAPYYRCVGQFPDWPLDEPVQRFSAFANTVDDAKTGLQWERNVTEFAADLAAAQAYCAGKGANWRLPTRAELSSIVKDTAHAPAIDISAFPNTPERHFWTSSPAAGPGPLTYTWLVDFADGQETFVPVGECAVRCVRPGRVP